MLAAEGVFAGSQVTPAVRLNDATDIWSARGSSYRGEQARPFRTARLDRARAVADLGLYAITFYNDVDRDVETLAAYAQFRDEAERAGMRHFLEVFNPAFEVKTGADFGFYLNDAISRVPRRRGDAGSAAVPEDGSITAHAPWRSSPPTIRRT